VGSAEWLRLYARQFEDQHAPQNLIIGMREAADEIERLKDGEARLRAALENIVNVKPYYGAEADEMLSIARTALGGDND